VNFHDVALAGDPERERAHRHAPRDPHASFALVLTLVRFLVKHLPLGGEFVFRPGLLQMDQRALARAIQPMLERGKWQELVFGKHEKEERLDCMHIHKQCACMTQVTIRQVEEEWVAKAKALAAEKGVSMNAVLAAALKKGLGVDGKPRTNGLERFSGTCPEGFGPEFEVAMEECSRIDEETWK
jgi:hypothetical protein